MIKVQTFPPYVRTWTSKWTCTYICRWFSFENMRTPIFEHSLFCL